MPAIAYSVFNSFVAEINRITSWMGAIDKIASKIICSFQLDLSLKPKGFEPMFTWHFERVSR